MGIKRFWNRQIHFKDKSGFVELNARFGRWMASDADGVFKEKVYIFPCLCFFFNHSEVFVQFAWLNFTFNVWHIDWKRKDAYREKMIMKYKKNKQT